MQFYVRRRDNGGRHHGGEWLQPFAPPYQYWHGLIASRRVCTIMINVTNETMGANAMAWTTPTLVEICIGLEINGYLPAEF